MPRLIPLIQPVISFAIRQAVGETGVVVKTAVEGWFRDNTQLVPKALGRSAERSWQAVGFAVGSDKLLARITGIFKSGDEKAYRDQVREFLRTAPLPPDMRTDAFRRHCHAEWKRAEGPVLGDGCESDPLAAAADGWDRFTAPHDLIPAAARAVAQVADALAADFPNLARLLREPTPAGPPLLAAAFAYFFRREVETTPELARGLTLDTLNHLVADQAARFDALDATLTGLGDQCAAILGELGEVHAAVTDIRTEVGEVKGTQQEMHADVRRIEDKIDSMLGRLNLRAELKTGDSVSIRSDAERRAVKQLLEDIRRLPADVADRVPEVHNGVGKLQVGIGDFDGATGSFHKAAATATDPARQAEAHFNAYRASLEKKDFAAALTAIAEAARLAPKRFAPFPPKRYTPRSVLGAGGFGTVFLCDDRRLGRQVAIKALHADDLDRGTDEIFDEARTLHDLHHPAVIRILDAEYADPDADARPYLVMEYFPGPTLAAAADGLGGFKADAFFPIAAQVAAGMHAAHTRGILHRDLKPDNVLVRMASGEPGSGEPGASAPGFYRAKIIDFGLALRKSTVETRSISRDQSIQGSSVAGTLRYAPPEQLGRTPGVKPGPYSDVYAFGKLCCYCLFRTTEPKRRHWDAVPGWFAELVERCTEEELADRLPNFTPVLDALAGYGAGLGIPELDARVAVESKKREAEEADRKQRAEEERKRQESVLPVGTVDPMELSPFYSLEEYHALKCPHCSERILVSRDGRAAGRVLTCNTCQKQYRAPDQETLDAPARQREEARKKTAAEEAERRRREAEDAARAAAEAERKKQAEAAPVAAGMAELDRGLAAVRQRQKAHPLVATTKGKALTGVVGNRWAEVPVIPADAVPEGVRFPPESTCPACGAVLDFAAFRSDVHEHPPDGYGSDIREQTVECAACRYEFVPADWPRRPALPTEKARIAREKRDAASAEEEKARQKKAAAEQEARERKARDDEREAVRKQLEEAVRKQTEREDREREEKRKRELKQAAKEERKRKEAAEAERQRKEKEARDQAAFEQQWREQLAARPDLPPIPLARPPASPPLPPPSASLPPPPPAVPSFLAHCPFCQVRVRVAEKDQNQRGRCPRCNGEFSITRFGSATKYAAPGGLVTPAQIWDAPVAFQVPDQADQAIFDSEFELTLDDPDEPPAAATEADRSIFDEDFEIPPFEPDEPPKPKYEVVDPGPAVLFTVACPYCRKSLRIPATLTGKRVKCKHCQGMFVVPTPGQPAVKPVTPPARTTGAIKQQCPSCEAMVSIKDPGLIGKKIDCPKCKYRFVVEDQGGDDEFAAGLLPPGAAFVQPCPSCEWTVPIKNSRLIGTKIDCPKCKYRFLVEEPARCPDCATVLDPPDAVICLHCGFNNRTRTRPPGGKKK